MVDTAVFIGDIATNDVKKVAGRIYDILVSPGIIPGLINGALTVPLDFGYLAIGYFNTDSRFAHQTQRIRMAEAIHNDILNYDNITNAVEKIFEKFNKYLTISQQDNVYRSVVSSVAGRLTTAKIVSSIGLRSSHVYRSLAQRALTTGSAESPCCCLLVEWLSVQSAYLKSLLSRPLKFISYSDRMIMI